MKKPLIFFIFFSFFTMLISHEYHVDEDAANEVKFISIAPLEEIEGITEKIDGYLYWQGDSYADSSELHFEVPLYTIDTGIGLRNSHMRDRYLETSIYPDASFSGKVTEVVSENENKSEVTLSGLLSIHGISQTKMVSGSIERIDASTLLIKASFSLLLTEFNIDIPQFAILKLNNEVKLELHFFVKKTEN